jgi:hypothetical protein
MSTDSWTAYLELLLLGPTHPTLVLVVSVFEPESVNMSRDIAQQRKANVDQQIRSTPFDKKHSKGRNKNLAQIRRIEGGNIP